MTAKEIARKIFYSPATNGKAEQSIIDGEKMILEYGQPQMHECKYCHAMTDKPDDTCYKAPKKKTAFQVLKKEFKLPKEITIDDASGTRLGTNGIYISDLIDAMEKYAGQFMHEGETF